MHRIPCTPPGARRIPPLFAGLGLHTFSDHSPPLPRPSCCRAGERAVLRAAMRVLLGSVEALAHERNTAPYGEAKETAALAALRLLGAVLDIDVEFVAAMRRGALTGRWECSFVIVGGRPGAGQLQLWQ
jgi:hypothetical protein